MATSVQRKAADQALEIARYNVGSTANQLDRTLEDFNVADKQNAALTASQLQANSKQSAADRFSQAKKLQSSTKGILGAAGNALQGSQLGSLISMIRDRSDLDTGEVLGTLRQNQNATQWSADESKNANAIARRDAINTAEFGLRGIEADTAAGLSNIDPSLYQRPGTPLTSDIPWLIGARRANVTENLAKASGYFLPDAAPKAKPAGATMQGKSYFDKLLNAYNQRRA